MDCRWRRASGHDRGAWKLAVADRHGCHHTPRYEAQEMLRAGGGASRGRVILAFDEEAWAHARKPWEKHWTVASKEGHSGGQGTVRRVQSRADPEQFGALKVLHDEHQTNRERRYRLLREVQ